jgi:hypothetical protein
MVDRIKMTYRYEIDKLNAIKVFDSNDVQILWQPDWPDFTPFADSQEAETWAEQFILSLSDPTADLPGDNPSEPTKPNPPVVMPEVIGNA